MSMDAMPIGVLFAATAVVVMAAFEAGRRFGHAARWRSADEKESPVGAIASSILSLTAFMLAFTFGMVTDRYDARKALVREEANAIGTACLRADLLPEPDRSKTGELFRHYVNIRLSAVQLHIEPARMKQILTETDQIQDQLWEMAVTHVRANMNSPSGALYLASLNEVFDIHALRVAVGMQVRTPGGIWLVLYILVILGMIGVGYQTAIADSGKAHIMPVLACAFSIVIALIASLDRPYSALAPVSQQPLETLRDSLSKAGEQK